MILLSFLLWNCSGISLLKSYDRPTSTVHTPRFLHQIGLVKDLHRQRNYGGALKQLKLIQQGQLSPVEQAFVENLMGVVLFSAGDLKRATAHFMAALQFRHEDQVLTAQIYLNLAGLYYKRGLYQKSRTAFEKINAKALSERDKDKLYSLGLLLGKSLKERPLLVRSLVGSMRGAKSIDEMKSHPYFETLRFNYFHTDDRWRTRMFNKNKDEAPLVVRYLSYLDAKRRYYEGNKRAAVDVLDWLKGDRQGNSEINELIEDFFARLKNYAKVNPSSIGVVLPLSGKKAIFGKRALFGIDKAVRQYAPDKYKIYIADSKGAASVGSYRIRQLAETNRVSTVIGGLFPQEAAEEYLEARKYGILFISLSQIYLPKDKKDHLLFEVPGSVESQIELLFSANFLAKFGRRAAIVYPQSGRGEAYVSEFWRKAKATGVSVTSVQPYKQNKTDYRDPVQNILGLKFTRERQEEYDLLSKIYEVPRKNRVRRIQVLRPQIDFDWIFIPAFPKEALQIIPSFSYYDAFRLNIIGGPSWRSHSLAKGGHRFVNLYFLGDDVSRIDEAFTDRFYELYKKKPRIIEILGHDAFALVVSLFKNASLRTRDELDIHIRSQKVLAGVTGNWNFRKGVWIKKLITHRLKEGRIEKL